MEIKPKKTFKSVLQVYFVDVILHVFLPYVIHTPWMLANNSTQNFQSDEIIPGYCCLCVCVWQEHQVFHTWSGVGAARRDLTSASMCAFGLVSGTKTRPANRTHPGSAETHLSDNNNQINRAHASVSTLMTPSCGLSRLGLGPLWSTGSSGYTELRRSQIGTVKLDQGVKVEKIRYPSGWNTASLFFLSLFLTFSLSLSCLNHLNQNHQTLKGRTIGDHMYLAFSNYN